MEPRVLPKPFDNFNSIKVQLEQPAVTTYWARYSISIP